MKEEPIYTVGQIAKKLNVAPRTVAMWCNRGLIEHYRLPTPHKRKDAPRRILHRNLVKFLHDHHMDQLLDRFGDLSYGPVICIGLSAELLTQLSRLLGDGITLIHARDFFTLGLLLSGENPTCVVMDFAAGRTQCLHAAKSIAEGNRLPVLGIAYEDEPRNTGEHRPFREVLYPPIGPGLIARKIIEALPRAVNAEE